MKPVFSPLFARCRRPFSVLCVVTALAWGLTAKAPAQSALTAQPLTYGPVHRYSFSQPAGVASSGDVLPDSVGVAHGVIRGNGATYTGTALRLSGGTSVFSPYVDLPNGIISGSATSYPGYTNASYEFWVTVVSNVNWSRIFDFGTGTSGEVAASGGSQTGTDYLMLTANVGTDPTVQFERSNGMPGGAKVTLANANSLGTEMHLVVTYDNTVGAWKWYKNGVFQNQISSLLGPDTILDNNNWLGRSQYTADSFANIAYREFRVYDYTLTPEQVYGNYLAGAGTLTSPAGYTGPFAWYQLNESLGTTAADSSGGGNPALLSTSGAGFATGGMVGNALKLTGGYARVPNSVALVNPTDAITLAAWINPTDWNGNRRILQKGATNNQYRLTADGGVLKFELANPVRTVTAALPAAATWSHVAATYDGVAMRLYVNGSVVGTTTTTGALATSTDDLFIGSYSATAAATETFAGLIDDVRLYDRALAASDINALATGVSMATPTATLQEGTSTGATITVTRTGNLSNSLSVTLALATGAGQAAAGTRFTTAPSNLALTIGANQATASVTVTPLSDQEVRGTEAVTLTAAPGASYFLAGGGSVTIQLQDSAINQWKIAKFGSVANAQAQGADGADPDGDGLSNLLEYALNADPLKADAAGLTASAVEGGKLTFTYNRLKNASNIGYHVLWSPDLATWTEPTVTEAILSDDGTVQRVKATLPGDGGASGYARLKVTRN